MCQLVICLQPNHPKAGYGDWENEYGDNIELSGSGYADKMILSLPLISLEQAKEIKQTINDGFLYDSNYLPKNKVNLKRLANNKNLRDNLQSLTYEQVISYLPTVSDPCEFVA